VIERGVGIQPKQRELMLAKRKYIAYGGARGGGKSYAMRAKAKIMGVEYPGIKILILRRTYKELQNNHIDEMRKDLNGIATYNSSEKRFRYPNGTSIVFGYCDSDGDVMQYQGAEYDVIMIDEATQLKEEWLKVFPACLRGVNEFPKRIYYTCNPGGPAHGYIKRLFIDGTYNPGENPDDYQFISALVTDNKALMQSQPDYIKQLEALPTKLRLAWLEGRWDVFSGQVFAEWTDDPAGYDSHLNTHVIRPFQTPGHYRVIRAFDWGYAKPFAVLWFCVDEERRYYLVRELYGWTGEPDVGVQWDPAEIARKIREIEADDPNLRGRKVMGVADPAIFKQDGGPSIADAMERERVIFSRGDNSRIAGKMQLHYRLRFNERGIPMLYVFSNCVNFIRTIPALIYSERDAEDVDTKQEDHAFDACRYGIMENALSPPKAEPRKPLPDDPLGLRDKADPMARLIAR
jgi:PBSX family phage terminase large subunit